MLDVHFDNIESVVKSRLLLAQKNIKVCVSWINFDTYREIFEHLLEKGVVIEIIINNDFINNRYIGIINGLKKYGAKIYMISMPTKRKYMHHKFCIIDEVLLISGSFNWTTNANQNNFENLFETDDIGVILKFKTEFSSIWSLSTNDIKMLQQLSKCCRCNNIITNMCVLSPEGDYQTKVEIYEMCSQCGIKCIKEEYFDISLYNNISSYAKYEGTIESNYYDGLHEENEVIENYINYGVKNYLSFIRNSRMEYPIIHAVGVYNYDFNGDRFVKILWKEKFVNRLIENEYYL